MRGLDAYITGGRYSRDDLLVTCPACDEKTLVTAETEYGATDWSRDTCEHCGQEFPEDAATELTPEPEPPDDWGDEYGRFEPWA